MRYIKGNFRKENGDEMLLLTSNTNKLFKIDIEDWDRIKNFTWSESPKGYIYTNVILDGIQKTIMLHHVLMGFPLGTNQIDHWNRDKSDNKKLNLIHSTPSENSFNRNLRITNKSGHSGVRKRKDNGKYTAEITVNRKRHYLGAFDTFEEAVNIRMEAEIKFKNGGEIVGKTKSTNTGFTGIQWLPNKEKYRVSIYYNENGKTKWKNLGYTDDIEEAKKIRYEAEIRRDNNEKL